MSFALDVCLRLIIADIKYLKSFIYHRKDAEKLIDLVSSLSFFTTGKKIATLWKSSVGLFNRPIFCQYLKGRKLCKFT